ncbi:hypothetical protein CHUAL_004604 [Chamberlinius hualienensis]
MHYIGFISFIFCIICFATVRCCVQHSPCVCVGTNFTLNFTDFVLNEPLRVNVSESHELFYKPCYEFTLGTDTDDGSCGQFRGVAVCVRNATVYKSWGTQPSAHFYFNERHHMYEIKYTDNNRVTYVLLNCTAAVTNESTLELNHFNSTTFTASLTLFSPYACNYLPPATATPSTTGSTDITVSPQPTPKPRSLSAGSILLIV